MNTVKYNTLSANPETEACELKNHIGETIRLHGAVYKIRRMRGGMCAAYGTGSCRGTF